MNALTNLKEKTPHGIAAHLYLTAEGIVLDQGPAWFWFKFLEFAKHFGYNNPRDEKGELVFKNVARGGKVWDTLKMFQNISKSWRFSKVISYIRVNDFQRKSPLNTEYSQGQYYCSVDMLFEGSDNDLGHTGYCVLRVPFIILVQPFVKYEESSTLFKPAAINDVQIIKSPIDFLIEQNYPQSEDA